MDLLQIIKLVSIPKWVKFFSLLTISSFVGIAVYAIFGGTHLAKGEIVQAGMGLLGVLLPLSIAIVLLTFYEAGVAPLKKASKKILLELLPEVLNRLVDPHVTSQQKIKLSHVLSQSHICLYTIELHDERSLLMELQLNVKKVCVVFYFEKQAVQLPSFGDLSVQFKHTLSGAKLEGYTSNNEIGEACIKDKNYLSLVLYKSLPADFLWNSAEKLYFAQDLQAMVNSMLREAGELLKVSAHK
jgi:hypothetical protein